MGFVYPGQYDHAIVNVTETAGMQAADVLTDPADPTGARFIAACQGGNWTLAGTLFHSQAAAQLRALAPALQTQGIQVVAEDTVQAGVGGSRLDVTAVDSAGQHYNIDWKTTGRSAFRASSRAELRRHAAHYQANRGAPLNFQISKSWVDFVRARIPNVRWPK